MTTQKEAKKNKGLPIETLNKIMMTKEAVASCELDGETQTDMTIEPLNKEAELEKEITNETIFEMLHLLDEKITKINNRFERLAKELGYKV